VSRDEIANAVGTLQKHVKLIKAGFNRFEIVEEQRGFQ
jgi:hypothetical protein